MGGVLGGMQQRFEENGYLDTLLGGWEAKCRVQNLDSEGEVAITEVRVGRVQ